MQSALRWHEATDIRSSGYRFLLEGVSNQNYVVDTSIDRVAWSMLGTNRLAGSTMELVDPGATNRSRQFYRARAVP